MQFSPIRFGTAYPAHQVTSVRFGERVTVVTTEPLEALKHVKGGEEPVQIVAGSELSIQTRDSKRNGESQALVYVNGGATTHYVLVKDLNAATGNDTIAP